MATAPIVAGRGLPAGRRASSGSAAHEVVAAFDPGGFDDALAAYDRIWFVVIAGGLVTTLLRLPMRTGRRAPAASPGAHPKLP